MVVVAAAVVVVGSLPGSFPKIRPSSLAKLQCSLLRGEGDVGVGRRCVVWRKREGFDTVVGWWRVAGGRRTGDGG